MEIIKSIILGIVQGLTEFLPISSSGHLEIFKVVLGFETGLNNNILFTLILHLATSFSVIVVYWNDIKKIFKSVLSIKKDENTYFFSLILISIFPAGTVGFFFEEKISNLFDGNIILVGSMLLFTSIILFISDFKIKTTNKLDYLQIPILINFRMNNFNFFIGPQIGKILNVKTEIKASTSNYNLDTASNLSSFRFEFNESKSKIPP